MNKPVGEITQAIADYLYVQMEKLDAPITMIACVALAQHVQRLCHPAQVPQPGNPNTWSGTISGQSFAQQPEWLNLDRIIDALERAGLCKNGQVRGSEDHVANTIRDWLKSLPSFDPAQQVQRDVIGWAAVEDGKIKVRSISDTRRAAIVNFLITDRQLMIRNSTSDAEIERLWFLHRGQADVEMVTITATLGDHPQPAQPPKRSRDLLCDLIDEFPISTGIGITRLGGIVDLDELVDLSIKIMEFFGAENDPSLRRQEGSAGG